MAKNFDPQALLYRWRFREDDGLPRFIGTDPALADRSKFFRWVDEPGGWERREPWAGGASNVDAVDNSVGLTSGWPGATPLRNPPGRPRKEYPSEEERPVTLSLSVRRAEVFDIQRRASDARKTVSEWICGVVRVELDRLSKEGSG